MGNIVITKGELKAIIESQITGRFIVTYSINSTDEDKRKTFVDSLEELGLHHSDDESTYFGDGLNAILKSSFILKLYQASSIFSSDDTKVYIYFEEENKINKIKIYPNK